MESNPNKEPFKIEVKGRVDSGNIAEVEADIAAKMEGVPKDTPIVIDAGNLEYISSAGLRALLRLKKAYPDFTIRDVSPEVYEILEMTGFTEIMNVNKAYRKVDVTGCEVIGEGANGKVYRIDRDNVVKTYKNADALAEIQNEREVAKLALILGIPTAISYDVVMVDDSYGSVFELLDADSFADVLAEEPERMEWCVDEYVKLLRLLHSTVVPEGKLPPIKDLAISWAEGAKTFLTEEEGTKLLQMIKDVPDRDTMVHGDCHTKNIVLAGDEVMVIDMDTLAVGHPIFEFGQMYSSFIGFSEYNHNIIKNFQGYDFETSNKFWHETLLKYFEIDDEDRIEHIEKKIRIVSYTRLVDWSRRHKENGNEEDMATRELWIKELKELLQEINNLDFEVPPYDNSDLERADNELVVEASVENLGQVQEFVNSHLESVGCSMRAKMQIEVAVEEIFVNIANYAYAPDKGNATVRVEVTEDPVTVIITFIDHGKPYDPLAKEDPDVTLKAEDRVPGGLGIFMTKQTMDGLEYEYKDGRNILKLKKNLQD